MAMCTNENKPSLTCKSYVLKMQQPHVHSRVLHLAVHNTPTPLQSIAINFTVHSGAKIRFAYQGEVFVILASHGALGNCFCGASG